MTVHVIILGYVQGVGFRYSIKKEAHALDCQGWVKNNSDRTVEVVATGMKENITKLISYCHTGPSGAEVGEVTVRVIEEQVFDTFEILK